VDLLQFFGVDLVRGAGGHADAAEALLAFAKSAGQLGNVAQDRAEQRQHGVGFVDRVMLLGLGAFGSGHGAPLVTIGPPAPAGGGGGAGLGGGGGSGGFVQTGSAVSFDAATAVGFSDAGPHAVSSGSLAKSMMQPSRL